MKVAVIGLGVIGTHHMNVLAKLGIEVCAVCDTDEDKLAKYPAVAHFTDYRQMIKEAKPDSVHVCTPHYLHAPMVIEALNADINVLCEKPLAINLEELNQILEAEEKSAGILGVCQQNRYNKTNLYIKQLVDAQPDKEKFVGSANVVWNRDKEYYNSAPWRGKWATEGGGVLIKTLGLSAGMRSLPWQGVFQPMRPDLSSPPHWAAWWGIRGQAPACRGAPGYQTHQDPRQPM